MAHYELKRPPGSASPANRPSQHVDATPVPESHPQRAALRQFAQGRLNETESRGIESHLETCARCCQDIEDLSADSDRLTDELVTAVQHGETEHATVPPALPRKIGRFEIARVVGEGGFGIVVLAHDRGLQRDVAIKIPKMGWMLTPDLRERFLREARAAASLDHPHIATVYDYGEENHVHYIASAFCHGPTLLKWLSARQEPVAPRKAAHLVSQLAQAIAHAHERGVLHRDLKPGNVLLEPTEEHGPAHGDDIGHSPRITDFGLAKLQHEDSAATRTSMILGTAAYMAPEQAAGTRGDVGPASDIYALGAVLYEILTGRPPFAGENDLEVLQSVRFEEPLPPTRWRPSIPRDLETITLKCLEKEPDNRYVSAKHLQDDLDRFLAGVPICARPVGRVERAWRWCRRNSRVAWLSVSTFTLLITLLVASTLSALWLSRQKNLTQQQLEKTQAAEALAARNDRGRRQELFAAQRSLARVLRTSGEAGDRTAAWEGLTRAAAMIPELELAPIDRKAIRDEMIACLAVPELTIGPSWSGYPPGTADTGIAFDAGLTRYARIAEDGQLQIRQLADNALLLTVTVDAPDIRAPDWRMELGLSPDGQWIAARQRWDDLQGPTLATRVWNAESGQVTLDLSRHSSRCAAMDFSPDSRFFAVALRGGRVEALEINSGHIAFNASLAATATVLRYDPEGTRLAAAYAGSPDSPSTVVILDTASGDVLGRLQHSTTVADVAWSRDGRLVATAGKDGTVYVWPGEGGHPISQCKGHDAEVVRVGFHPRYPILFSHANDGTSRLWDIASATELLSVRGAAARFSRDGNRLGFGYQGSQVGWWHVVNSGAWVASDERIQGIQSVDVGAGGRLLALGRNDGVSFVAVKSGRRVGELVLEGGGHAVGALFHPDGALITCSANGLQEWPVSLSAAERLDNGRHDVTTISIGPATTIDVGGESAPYWFDIVADGTLLFSRADRIGVEAVDPRRSIAVSPRFAHTGLHRAARSLDGRWTATSAWHGYETRIWDNRTGELHQSIPGRSAVMQFRPDGNELAVSTPDDIAFYRVDDGSVSHHVPRIDAGVAPPIDYSLDGRWFAYAESEFVCILNTASHDQVATLIAPVAGQPRQLRFSPESSRLMVATYSGDVHVWDLSLLNDRLGSQGLNWHDGRDRVATDDIRVVIDP